MSQQIDSKPAPGRLERVQRFLNTWSDELGIERLADPEDAKQWLVSAGYSCSSPPTPQELDRLREFRSSLRSLLRGDTPVDRLTELLAGIGFHMAFVDNQIQLKTKAGLCEEVIGELAIVILESQHNGTWSRLKCCQLDSCGWAFYDHTKNRSGRWCSMKTCGSRHKAREYQKRKARRDASGAAEFGNNKEN